MQVVGSNTSFSFEYAVSLIIIIVIINMLLKKSPNMNMAVVVIIGLVVGYILLKVLNFLIPNLNSTASSIRQYISFMITNHFNNMGYFIIFPPLFIVLIIFIALLYSGKMG